MKEIVSNHLKEVRRRMRAACDRAGREIPEITLIAVSKTKPLEALQAAYACDVRDFGENKVQEILQKAPRMPRMPGFT